MRHPLEQLHPAGPPEAGTLYPHFCVVQVNNVFNMPQKLGDKRWVAYPHPQVIFQYYDGRTGVTAGDRNLRHVWARWFRTLLANRVSQEGKES
jgi:hypothetical protein